MVILSKPPHIYDWENQDGQTATTTTDLKAAPGAGKHLILGGFSIAATGAITAKVAWPNSAGGALVERFRIKTVGADTFGLSNLNLKLPENCKLSWEITAGTAYITVWGRTN